MLRLSDGLVLPLSPVALSIGRATQSEDAEPDLPLELLDHPRGARWDPKLRPGGARLDAIDLSRRHVLVTLDNGQLEIGMAKGKAPAFTLDEELRLIQELAPGIGDCVRLEPGQHLLVGGYLFRFQREKSLAVTSTMAHKIPAQPG